MKLWAKWSIAGIILEGRELTSKKNDKWRGYILKVASLGRTFELNCEADQFHKLSAGEHFEFIGTFDEAKGDKGTFLKYVLEAWRPAEAEPVVADQKGGGK